MDESRGRRDGPDVAGLYSEPRGDRPRDKEAVTAPSFPQTYAHPPLHFGFLSMDEIYTGNIFKERGSLSELILHCRY